MALEAHDDPELNRASKELLEFGHFMKSKVEDKTRLLSESGPTPFQEAPSGPSTAPPSEGNPDLAQEMEA